MNVELSEVLSLLQRWGKMLRLESQDILDEEGYCYEYRSLGDQISLLAHLVVDVKKLSKIK